MVLGLFKPVMKDQEEPKQVQDKPPEEQKSPSAEAFLKTPETQKFVSEWKKKGYTRRGLNKLFMTLWVMHGSDAKVRKAAKDIVSSLIGEDGLGKVLSALKLVPEGLRKLVG